MDEQLAAAEEGMALVSALDDALLVRHAAAKLEMAQAGEMKALDDSDMDMDMDIDVDVFRPSAMLDSRLDEEFGSARGFGGLWASDGMEQGHVDLEHMLLSESDEELLGLIKQEQAGLLCDPLRRRVFAIRAGRIAADSAVDAAQFPPKYASSAAADAAATGRSVFRHTFGARTQRFGFAASSNASPVGVQSSRAQASVAHAVPCQTMAKNAARVYEADLAEQEDHKEEEDDVDMEVDDSTAGTPVVAAAAFSAPTCTDFTIKQEIIKEEPVVLKQAVADTTPATPVRPTPTPRPVDPSPFASPAIAIASASRREEAAFHTPLRRSMSSPASSAFSSPPPTALSEKTSFVSLDRMAAIEGVGFAHHHHSSSESDLVHTSQFRSMSPADELEKVAALHDKGTLGKLDKVAWDFSSTPARSSELDSGNGRDTSAQSGEGSADRPPILVVAGSPATPLPPRYIKGPADTEKRRVHSSTFQSFARSFSFSSASSSSSALD